ncbi:MAG TPA: hypothetical protein PK079_26350 [Leptospiraceae bacterium]|nr:hypothetical protein [Leptospiraceae bacterium]HMW08674.1 hypothetical protein [Leptospiraceae bacterium]HMX35546.1 hypothetical protein [Leptospiraceae bacterium]HMY34455.1 hypothetical protein [Leptospiraceae bacterium]HMZ67553.1 hypothetical protein [Leptospiraceae bacterium]
MAKRKSKFNLLIGGLGLLGAGAVYYKTGTGRIVKNSYKNVIHVKPESSVEAQPIPAGSLVDKIDGISTPFRPNQVYKVPNRMDVEITETGDVKPVNSNFIDGLAFEVGILDYGWRDKTSAWYQKLLKSKDTGWDELFETSAYKQ